MKTIQETKDDRRSPGGSSTRQGSGDPTEMIEKMEAAGKPGPAHKVLDALVGEWKAEVKCWAQPGTHPDVSSGSAKAAWQFNGRFLEEIFQGSMMGRPFTGRTQLGYDNTKRVYTSVWVSDTQTSIFVSEGTADQANKVITLHGTSTCPVNGQRQIKSVLRLLGPQEHVFEMFDESEGRSAKTMEIRYTR